HFDDTRTIPRSLRLSRWLEVRFIRTNTAAGHPLPLFAHLTGWNKPASPASHSLKWRVGESRVKLVYVYCGTRSCRAAAVLRAARMLGRAAKFRAVHTSCPAFTCHPQKSSLRRERHCLAPPG